MNTLIAAMMACTLGPVPAPEFLDPHDPIWERPPLRWLDGIPLANGDIGTLVWGDGEPLKVTLDKYDAWETRERILGPGDITYAGLRGLLKDGKTREAEACLRTDTLYPNGAPYPTRLPMPRLELRFGHPFAWSRARLRLRDATAEITADVAGEPLGIRLAVLANENVLLIRLEGKPAAAARLHVGLDHLNADAKATLKRWGYGDPVVTQETATSGTLHLKTPTGYEYAIAWASVPCDAGNAHVICLSLLSNADAADPLAAAKDLARRSAEAGAAGGLPACAARTDNQPVTPAEGDRLAPHRAWWADYWKRSYLTIPEARLESLYYIEMYKLGCCSRPGKYPVTLQGLWTLDGGMPPWSGDYHLDMNVQQSYWPIYAANRLDLGEPLYRTFSACLPRWREQCKQFFGFDGIMAGCAIGPHGERIFGYSGVEMWPGNAAWLAHHYWLHFLYSQDRQFLREQALPLLRLAFLTYANLLERGADGKLHVPLSYSPEWGEGGVDGYCTDPNIDLALIRFLAGAIIRSAEVLREPSATAASAASSLGAGGGAVDTTAARDALAQRARDVLAQLAPYVQSGNRLFVRAGTPLSHSHRHHSHLAAIYPLGVLSIDDGSTDRALIEGSLLDIRTKGTGEWTGWAFPWMSLIAARAGRGNMAWQMLDTYTNAFITPNTFHVNGDPRVFGSSLFTYEPMTLEAGFGAAAAIMEMLLQSHDDLIRLFPAIPDRWHDAYFADLRAEGAFLVTARLTAGRVTFVGITSEAGRPCRVRNPFGGPATISVLDPTSGALAGEALPLGGDTLGFETKPNARYLLYPVGRRPGADDMRPPQYPRTDAEQHFYGLKKFARF
jgi:alpha-L-fucosidase 2